MWLHKICMYNRKSWFSNTSFTTGLKTLQTFRPDALIFFRAKIINAANYAHCHLNQLSHLYFNYYNHSPLPVSVSVCIFSCMYNLYHPVPVPSPLQYMHIIVTLHPSEQRFSSNFTQATASASLLNPMTQQVQRV